MENKLRAFEYIVIQLAKLHLGKQLNEQLTVDDVQRFNADGGNDFSKLKLLKLLFLVCVLSEDRVELLALFNNFYAMQYGPVELEVYEAINGINQDFEAIEVDNLHSRLSSREQVLQIEQIEQFGNIENQVFRQIIDTFLSSEVAVKIVKYSHWQLVELTHKYQSWKSSFNIAKAQGRGLYPMFSEDIIADGILINNG